MSRRGGLKIFRRGLNLPKLFALVFGIGLAASAFLNVTQHDRAESDRKLMQGQITDLRYQLQQDQASATPRPSATPEALATPEVTPSPAPTVAPSPAGDALGATAPKTTTVKKTANLHAGPNTTSKVVLSYTQVPVGATVELGVLSGKWQQVTAKGVTGYLLASYLN